jgi:hypothetical protein
MEAQPGSNNFNHTVAMLSPLLQRVGRQKRKGPTAKYFIHGGCADVSNQFPASQELFELNV